MGTAAGLVTMVLRRAPTATRLWKAIPEMHDVLSSPAYLLDFLRKCIEWDNETVFRATEKTFGRGNVRWLLEATNPE